MVDSAERRSTTTFETLPFIFFFKCHYRECCGYYTLIQTRKTDLASCWRKTFLRRACTKHNRGPLGHSNNQLILCMQSNIFVLLLKSCALGLIVALFVVSSCVRVQQYACSSCVASSQEIWYLSMRPYITIHTKNIYIYYCFQFVDHSIVFMNKLFNICSIQAYVYTSKQQRFIFMYNMELQLQSPHVLIATPLSFNDCYSFK